MYSDPEAILPVEERIKQSILKAMQFGQELIAEFGVQNVLTNKTTAEVAHLAAILAPAQALLLSGALHTAKEWIQSSAADELPQDTRDYFVSRIDSYLGGPS